MCLLSTSVGQMKITMTVIIIIIIIIINFIIPAWETLFWSLDTHFSVFGPLNSVPEPKLGPDGHIHTEKSDLH